jgi:multidrug efflux pump subunit AcrB
MADHSDLLSSGSRRSVKPERGHGAFREFRPTSFAIEHSTSIIVFTVAIILMGLAAYITVPREASPSITIPNILVNTIYPGVAPRDIETLLTRPIEEKLNTIGDVKTITSISDEGYSSINVEFEPDVDMNEALQKVREKVDLAKPDLPAAAEEPQIVEINFSEFPIMQVNVAGTYGLVRLRAVAEDLKEDLEQIPSVLEVTMAGGLEREVQVDVDLPKLKFYGLSFDDVIDAILAENVTVPGGTIDVGNRKYLVRVPGEFQTPAPIADIVVATRKGRAIYIRDVATVEFGFKERESFARMDGNPVVSLAIKKRLGRNIIETADAVHAAIAAREARFPPGTSITITADQSDDIANMVSSLQNNIISGLILVVGVLLFFLGARTSWFVGLAIPLSMLLSFAVIKLLGYTLNMVVLFSLILALGMLVDNAIVVVENIYRFREHGHDRIRAAKFATGEVAWPIIASTATTLAAFLPMAFWPGIVGEFMVFLPLTLIITLSSSLFVGLVIVPTLCSLLLNPEDEPRSSLPRSTTIGFAAAAGVVFLMGLVINWLTTVLLLGTVAILYSGHHYVLRPVGRWFMAHGLPAMLTRYEKLLWWALGHRMRMVGGALATLVLAIMVFGAFNAGVEFFPEDIPPASAYVQVESPLGTRVEETDRIMRAIEDRLQDIPGREDVTSVVATVGSQTTANFSGASSGTHLGTTTINFADFDQRQGDAFQTLEHLRNVLPTLVAGAEVTVEKPQDGPPTGRPITIEITGDDPDTLKRLGDTFVDHLERSSLFGRLDGLESNMADARPELIVEVDREKAALYGLNTRDVGWTVRNAINGSEASKYRDAEDEYDITVRLARAYREDLEALGDLTVVADGGRQVPLSSVAQWYVGEGVGAINRKDLKRMVTVSSDVRSGNNANAVLQEVQAELATLQGSLPVGYVMRYAGQQQEQAESQAFLTGAFTTALLLIALILVSQFNSVIKPFIIMSSVLLSTVGVLIGLLVFRMPFGIIMTGVGVISLAGVVVNNAIVLIDYVDTLRTRDGLRRREALVRGGITRFRPVVLTAITTVLGLVPLAIGLNFDFIGLYTRLSPNFYWGGEQASWWGPMAIAVIAGLTFATFLTLVLVPVMYSLLDDLEQAIRRRFQTQPVPATPDLEAAGGGLAAD